MIHCFEALQMDRKSFYLDQNFAYSEPFNSDQDFGAHITNHLI